MITTQRKFENGTRVICGPLKLDLIIVDAVETLTGWRYQLAFPTKSGTIHKAKNHRFFYEKDLIPKQ